MTNFASIRRAAMTTVGLTLALAAQAFGGAFKVTNDGVINTLNKVTDDYCAAYHKKIAPEIEALKTKPVAEKEAAKIEILVNFYKGAPKLPAYEAALKNAGEGDFIPVLRVYHRMGEMYLLGQKKYIDANRNGELNGDSWMSELQDPKNWAWWNGKSDWLEPTIMKQEFPENIPANEKALRYATLTRARDFGFVLKEQIEIKDWAMPGTLNPISNAETIAINKVRLENPAMTTVDWTLKMFHFNQRVKLTPESIVETSAPYIEKVDFSKTYADTFKSILLTGSEQNRPLHVGLFATVFGITQNGAVVATNKPKPPGG